MVIHIMKHPVHVISKAFSLNSHYSSRKKSHFVVLFL